MRPIFVVLTRILSGLKNTSILVVLQLAQCLRRAKREWDVTSEITSLLKNDRGCPIIKTNKKLEIYEMLYSHETLLQDF